MSCKLVPSCLMSVLILNLKVELINGNETFLSSYLFGVWDSKLSLINASSDLRKEVGSNYKFTGGLMVHLRVKIIFWHLWTLIFIFPFDEPEVQERLSAAAKMEINCSFNRWLQNGYVICISESCYKSEKRNVGKVCD